jgi:Family of unknown function (DUF5906)/RepB DNA-primase from phage plasmid
VSVNTLDNSAGNVNPRGLKAKFGRPAPRKWTIDQQAVMRHLDLLDPSEGAEFDFQVFDDDKARKEAEYQRRKARREQNLEKIEADQGKDAAKDWSEKNQLHTDDRARQLQANHGNIGDVLESLDDASADGCGIFVAVNRMKPGGRGNKNVIRIRGVIGDFDDGIPASFPLFPTMTVRTSIKNGVQKGQAYWLLKPGEELTEEQRYQITERIAVSYGHDPRAMDAARVLRLAGTHHCKDPANPQMVTLHADEEPRYTRDELLAAFPPLNDDERETLKPPKSSDKKSAAAKVSLKATAAAFAKPINGKWITNGLGDTSTGLTWAEKAVLTDKLTDAHGEMAVAYVTKAVTETLNEMAALQPGTGRNSALAAKTKRLGDFGEYLDRETIMTASIAAGEACGKKSAAEGMWGRNSPLFDEAAAANRTATQQTLAGLNGSKAAAVDSTDESVGDSGNEAATVSQSDEEDDAYKIYVTEAGALRAVSIAHRKDFNAKALAQRIGHTRATKELKKPTIFDGVGCDLSRPYGDVLVARGGKKLINTFGGFEVTERFTNDVAVRQGIQAILDLITHVGSDEREVNFSTYLFNQLAWKWQNKHRAPKVAIALRSDAEGTGKGTFVKLCEALFNPCTFVASNPKHIVGGFNKHLAGVAVLIADEAMFAGDPRIRGQLFSVITEPTLTIEGKGRDAYQTANPILLIITTNSKWAVPASITARRFAVADVPASRVGDRAFWSRVHAAIENPEVIAAFADILAKRKLGSWKPWAHVPQTKALMRQKRQSMRRDLTGYLLRSLERGYFEDGRLNGVPITPRKAGSGGKINGNWGSEAVDIYQSHVIAILDAASHYAGHEITQRDLMKAMEELLDARKMKNNGQRFVRLGQLDRVRAAFETATKIAGEWSDDGDAEEVTAAAADNVTAVQFGKPSTETRARTLRAKMNGYGDA